MVKTSIWQCLIVGILFLVPGEKAQGQEQSPAGMERRVAELEEKMRLIDPAFGQQNRAQDLARRLDLLEKKMTQVLAARGPASEPQAPQQVPAETSPAAAGAQPPTQPARQVLLPVS